MNHISIILFISSVFVLGLCKEDTDAEKKLNQQISQTEEKIRSLDEENARLRDEIKEETNKYVSKIKIDEQIRNKGTAENQAQHKVLEDLYRQLAKSYMDEEQLKQAPQNIDKLKLAINVMKENIKTLDARRENGMTKSCLELEKMAENSTHNVPSILKTITIRITIEIVLENKLRLLWTELMQAKNRNKELKFKLKSLRMFYDEYTKNLNEAIQRIGEDHKKGQEKIDLIKKELEKGRKRIEQLQNSTGAAIADLKKWKAAAKKVLDKYKQYALEVECYRKLLSDVLALVTPRQ